SSTGSTGSSSTRRAPCTRLTRTASEFRSSSLAARPRQPDDRHRVREAIRVRHYSGRTEEAYTAWIRRFIVFHGKRHPSELGEAEVSAFVSHLATRGVA